MYHITPGSRPQVLQPAAVAQVVTDNHALIKEYLDWKASYTSVAARTYERWVRRFQELTNKVPESICLSDWTTFALSLQGQFAPKGIEFALSIVHNYLRFWHEQGRLRLPLYLVRVKAARARTHNAITEDEYRKLLGALRAKGQTRDLVIIRLLHDTGMRGGELARLEIEQIEEDASAIIGTEKTIQRRRVFWNRDTDQILHNYIVERINDGPDTPWLFAGRSSRNHLTLRQIERIVDQACVASGIERRITPHSFRHGFIHRHAALGVPDAMIAQLVGHGSPHSISHYTKLSRPEAEAIARRQFNELALAA